MASAGPFNPSANAENTSVGTLSIASRANAYASDNVYASAGSDEEATQSYYGVWTGFGITSANVPNDATINGVLFEIEARRGGLNPATSLRSVKVVKAGTIVGAEKGPTALTGTDTYYNFGGAADLHGTTWTPAEIQNAGFGVAVSTDIGSNASASIDHIRVTITYTEVVGGIAASRRSTIII